MAQQDNAKQLKIEAAKQANYLKDQALGQVNQVKGQVSERASHLFDVAYSAAQTYVDHVGDEYVSAKKGLTKRVKAEPLNALLVAGAVGFLAGLLARGK